MGKENQFHTVLSVCLLRFKYCTPREKKKKKKHKDLPLRSFWTKQTKWPGGLLPYE